MSPIYLLPGGDNILTNEKSSHQKQRLKRHVRIYLYYGDLRHYFITSLSNGYKNVILDFLPAKNEVAFIEFIHVKVVKLILYTLARHT